MERLRLAEVLEHLFVRRAETIRSARYLGQHLVTSVLTAVAGAVAVVVVKRQQIPLAVLEGAAPVNAMAANYRYLPDRRLPFLLEQEGLLVRSDRPAELVHRQL
jgi:hypothetical protein